MKTPMQKLITLLDNSIPNPVSGVGNTPQQQGYKEAVGELKQIVQKLLLEEEKKIIVAAAETTLQSMTMDYACEFKTGEEYYNETFKAKQ